MKRPTIEQCLEAAQKLAADLLYYKNEMPDSHNLDEAALLAVDVCHDLRGHLQWANDAAAALTT